MLQSARSLYECWNIGKLDDHKFREGIVWLQRGAPLSADCDNLLRKQGPVRDVKFKDFVQSLRRSTDSYPSVQKPLYARGDACSAQRISGDVHWAQTLTSPRQYHERKHFPSPPARGVPEEVLCHRSERPPPRTSQRSHASPRRVGLLTHTKSLAWDPPPISPRNGVGAPNVFGCRVNIETMNSSAPFRARSPRQIQGGAQLLRESKGEDPWRGFRRSYASCRKVFGAEAMTAPPGKATIFLGSRSTAVLSPRVSHRPRQI
eukprot:GEMP01031341.1.p1 GENE.GEMP01031341.1~~GEMP01031341.1.p1  ORF type:complete len:287 (+),score=31.36 GEMP01031341.1:79-861(+)